MILKQIDHKLLRCSKSLTFRRLYAIPVAVSIILVLTTFIIACAPTVTVKRINELALYPPTTKNLDVFWKEYPKLPHERLAMMRVRNGKDAEDILQGKAKELGADAIVFMGKIKIGIDFPLDYYTMGPDPYFEAYEVDLWAVALKYK